MTDLPLTPHIQGVINASKQMAEELQRDGVDIDILFECFLKNLSLSCTSIFEKAKIPKEIFLLSKEVILKKRAGKKVSTRLRNDVQKFFSHCDILTKQVLNLDYIPPEVLLMVFFDKDICPKAIKHVLSFTEEKSSNIVTSILREAAIIVKDFNLLEDEEFSEEDEVPEDWIDMFDENPILSQFAENLNIKAANQEFDKIVDFDNKIDELATILCRKKKPNAILVGPAGTGKTSLVEGLASKIINGDAPELLANKVIYSVSLSSMVAGTEYRGQFEKRLEDFVNEAKKYSNLILFIDEIHTLVGAGGSGSNQSLEASNILKPELARGTISCIGATTINEYNNTIKKDSALDRRFERVTVREPSRFQMKEILPTITSYYEEFHKVKYSDSFINNVIDYCEKYTPNKFYPDKAIDVIDHCGAQAKVSFWEIDPSVKEIQKQIIDATLESDDDHNELFKEFNSRLEKWKKNIGEETPEVKLCHLKLFFDKKVNPLNKRDMINNIFNHLEKSLVGQKSVLNNMRQKIIISSLGLKTNDDYHAPECFAISGIQSSGKSLFTSLFKDSLEKQGVNILAYNGVHFSDDFAPYKIVSDRNSNSSLCEKIAIHPNSVIIIDDFHKIHHSSIPLFNQIFKEGKLQMPNGEIADFSNCKFFVTSSMASGQSSIGFNIPEVDKNSLMIHPEIISIVKECFFLKELSQKDLRRILWTKLNKMKQDLKIQDVNLEFNFKFIKSSVNSLINESSKINALNSLIDKKIYKRVSDDVIIGKPTVKLV
jgi:ATP-dependent Clp protease ATP-binding subunit ClpC